MLRNAQRQRLERVLAGIVGSCPGVIVATVASKDATVLASHPEDPLGEVVGRAATALCALAEGAGLEMECGSVSQLMIRAERAHLVAQWLPSGSVLAVLCSSKTALGGVVVEVSSAARELASVL
jgi:predicted regulator of Ras-like GTPase activity (Roadblock/LC7/MglB family)